MIVLVKFNIYNIKLWSEYYENIDNVVVFLFNTRGLIYITYYLCTLDKHTYIIRNGTFFLLFDFIPTKN